jgi:hypothetical protein
MSKNTIKTMQANNAVVYAGVDVAKATLQLHLQGQQSEFSNTPKGLHWLCVRPIAKSTQRSRGLRSHGWL